MDRSTLWPIVKLSRRTQIHISVNISGWTAKTSLACIKSKREKNDVFSLLIDLTNHAFPYPRLAQGDSPSVKIRRFGVVGAVLAVDPGLIVETGPGGVGRRQN